MPKRYRNNEIWQKKNFRELEPKFKLFWFYIMDQCNHGGIWHVDFDNARFLTGEKTLIMEDVLNVFGDKIEVITPEVWHIPDFIEEQYGSKILNDEIRYQKSALEILKVYNLDKQYLDENKLSFKND